MQIVKGKAIIFICCFSIMVYSLLNTLPSVALFVEIFIERSTLCSQIPEISYLQKNSETFLFSKWNAHSNVVSFRRLVSELPQVLLANAMNSLGRGSARTLLKHEIYFLSYFKCICDVTAQTSFDESTKTCFRKFPSTFLHISSSNLGGFVLIIWKGCASKIKNFLLGQPAENM